MAAISSGSRPHSYLGETDAKSCQHDELDRGASAVEYALLLALIAAVIIGTVITLGGEVADLYESVNWWDD